MTYDNFPVGTVQGSNGWVSFKGHKEGKVRKQAEDYAAAMEMT